MDRATDTSVHLLDELDLRDRVVIDQVVPAASGGMGDGTSHGVRHVVHVHESELVVPTPNHGQSSTACPAHILGEPSTGSVDEAAADVDQRRSAVGGRVGKHAEGRTADSSEPFGLGGCGRIFIDPLPRRGTILVQAGKENVSAEVGCVGPYCVEERPSDAKPLFARSPSDARGETGGWTGLHHVHDDRYSTE